MRVAIYFYTLLMFADTTWAQESMRPWTTQAIQGEIALSEDFCEVCGCCQIAESWTELEPELPTVPKVQIFRTEAFESLKFLNESLGAGSNRILPPLIEGARLEGIIDFCNACQCCVQHPAGLEVSPPTLWNEDLYGQYEILAK